MLDWIKKGKVFDPVNRFEWMQHYSQVPTPLELSEAYRIFFACRPLPDKNGRYVSYTGFVDLKKDDLTEILYISPSPVLENGTPGTFDEFGIHPTSLLAIENKLYLYFTGWNRGYTVPYETSIGLAVSTDNGTTFQKIGAGPIITKSINEPFLQNGAFVIEYNNMYYMFYASAEKWHPANGKLEPIYTLTYAISSDGIKWNKTGVKCFKPKLKNECISRPTIIALGNGFHMWFAYRSADDFRFGENVYKIGYAFSEDLKNWIRNDEQAGIFLSENGWDSQMMAYPSVIKRDDSLLMFYNGNDFGKGGFGYAISKLGK
jgi:predicted GH43/DUF377 family glycosyl hydrolase